MQKITPFLWFDGQAEEAVSFYTQIFKNSKTNRVSRNKAGAVVTASFELDGQPFLALNGGPNYKFSPAISLFVNCEDQEEIDHLWQSLTNGGEAQRCGWLKDKFGISWQVVPSILGQLLSDKDPVKAGKAMQAMLKMDKIIIEELLEVVGSQ